MMTAEREISEDSMNDREDGRSSRDLDEPHYKARNVYFQFGHKAELFQSSTFTQLFLNSIRWASGR